MQKDDFSNKFLMNIHAHLICSRCLNDTHEHEFHATHTDMCTQCGQNFDMVLRIRKNLEPYNPPNPEKFRLKIVSGEHRTICPNCGSRAKLYGIVVKSIYCKFCDFSFTQLNSGIVSASRDSGHTQIPYLSNDHLPFFDRYSTTVEKNEPIDLDLLLGL